MMIRWVMRMWSYGRTDSVGGSLETRFRVSLVDLDILMHMTNGRYLSILDAARIAYYARTGLWRQFRARGWSPVVTAQTITYLRPLTWAQQYRVRTTLLGTDAKNLYFVQAFHVGSVDYASATVSVRVKNRNGGSVTPAEFLSLDAIFELPPELPDAVSMWAEQSRRTDTMNARRP